MPGTWWGLEKDGFHFFQFFPGMWLAQKKNEWNPTRREEEGDDFRRMVSLCVRTLLLIYVRCCREQIKF